MIKMTKLFSCICAFAILAGCLCGCGPTEEEILTPQTIEKIEAKYREETGENTKFIKARDLRTNGADDYFLEAVIERGGKRYLATMIMIQMVDNKPVVSVSSIADKEL